MCSCSFLRSVEMTSFGRVFSQKGSLQSFDHLHNCLDLDAFLI